MEPETIKALKQAASFIRGGDTKSARGILIPLLRDEPDNVQAWFMLSYAVPNPDKQIYAVQQTLRLDPTNEKALRRLTKLGGEIPPSVVAAQSRLQQAPPAPKPTVQPAEDPDADLLRQRLFGEPAEKPKKPAQELPAEPQQEETGTAAAFTSTPPETMEDDTSEYPYDEILEPRPFYQKITKQQRILILAAIGAVILGLLSIFVIRPWIVNFL
ncbi:MAG: hypothetical protein P8046_11960, partial [Anaerolineales bacterium]